MATIPIYNKTSPFLGLIPGGFRVGSTLKVRAEIQGYSNRLQINIQSGAALKPRDDTMLHISVRPQENVIVRNHMQNQNFGAEERHGGNPIQAHQSFEIAITAEHAQYRIAINNQHHSTFQHRLPLNLAQYISISGTCTIAYITIDQTGPSIGFPPVHVNPNYPIITPAQPYPVHHHHHHHNPPVPPPMPMPTAPPPYPGHYPGHHQATPYTTQEDEQKDKKKALKVAAGVGAIAGLTAVAFSKAAKDIRRKK